MSSTDYLRLNDHKIFKNVRDTLPKDIRKTENILTVNEDMLYTWDLRNNCVLTLNIKAARSREGDNVSYQTLLPNYPPLFAPELVISNASNTLLVVAGPNGVLVLELPARCPPYGAFAGNKEIVYCRSHSLEERLLCCGGHIEVRQVRFHPGSPSDNHIVVLTNDNFLRLYHIFNGSAVALSKYQLGTTPMSLMPGSKMHFLTALGETAIDFDFGPPELEHYKKISENDIISDYSNKSLGEKSSREVITYKDLNESLQKLTVEESNKPSTNSQLLQKNLKNMKNKWGEMQWPIYILYGNTDVCTLTICLNEKSIPKVRGPLPIIPEDEITIKEEACAIICLNTYPTIMCIAMTNGNIYHSVILPDTKQFLDKPTDKYLHKPDRSLYVFEKVELELGLATTNMCDEYCCPIFLHLDDSRSERYFATHETGVHSVTIPSVNSLQKFISGPGDDADLEDVVKEPSCAEYLICTKVTNSDYINPIIGFALYYDSLSLLTLLSNGQTVTLSLTSSLLPTSYNIDYEGLEKMDSPLKKMLKEPFDVYIQKILRQAKSQPILKVSSGGQHTQQECYEILQRAAQVFRDEHFRYYQRASEEIEKRLKALHMLKKCQTDDLEKIMKQKYILKEKAGNLAEKYEDIKEMQDKLTKRCQKLLLLLSQKKSEPSDAEKKFLEDLKKSKERAELFSKAIERLKKQRHYQERQMENWKKQNIRKETGLGSVQSRAIRSNLQSMSNQVADMIREVQDYKSNLGLE